MFGTKVEITLPKAEPGHWSHLEFRRSTCVKVVADKALSEEANRKVTATSGNDSDVDLEEIEPLRAVRITEA